MNKKFQQYYELKETRATHNNIYYQSTQRFSIKLNLSPYHTTESVMPPTVDKLLLINIINQSKKNKMGAFTPIILMFMVLTSMSYNREIQKYFTMQELKQADGWLYVDKIVLSIGQIDIKMTTQKFKGQTKISGTNMFLVMISDENWLFSKQKKCNYSLKEYQQTISHQLLLSQQISISQRVIPITKEQLYYFILLDCERKLWADDNNNQLTIKLKLQIINNGKFMGEEQDHWLIIPVIIVIGIWIIVTDKNFLKNQFQNDPDYAKMIMFGAIAFDVSSLIWRSFGYLIYRNIGTNYLFFHLIYLLMHSLSETMTLCLLILISMGWSLNFITGPKFDIALPILSFLIIINIILTLMTQLSNSTHDVHHTYDAVQGRVLIIIRSIIGIIFIVSAIRTYNESTRYRIRNFLKKFMIYGLLYIFSIPIIIWIVNRIIPKKERNQFVFILIEIIKNICNICLMYMVSSSRSQYKKLAYKNISVMNNKQIGLFQF